ncbi:cell division ATP-binding protein FtsE [Agromyces aurantiacus]|uniref:Cell division ATP-binding protein FtsE n=1 Tax=Agromyces aurantiacus TaxID=165814 RepID=A0ABV9RCN4_9MICO
MIRFDSVTMTYPGQGRPALDDVTVEILRGEFVFLVGASGSGKSSFLRLILKEERPSAGQIHVLGQDLRRISTRKVPYFRRNLGVVFQDFRLLPNKNVFDNVAFALRVIGKSRGFIQTAVPETLRLVGLDGKGKRMPHELSGGEQQRVAIARAIVNKPQILLADEPTGNLDPVTSAGIMTLLERINASGTTVVMATHEAGIVDQMQRRVIELSSGELVRDERSAGYAITSEAVAREVETTDAAAAPAAAAPAARAKAPARAGGGRKPAARTSAARTKAAAPPVAGETGEPAAANAVATTAPVEPVAAPEPTSAETTAAAAAAAVAAARSTTGRGTGKSSRKKKAAPTDAVLHDAGEFDTTAREVPATGEDADAVVAALRDEESAPGTITSAAPKVTREVMRDAPPLYIEPEATDEVTDEAAAITAAATAPIERLPDDADEEALAAASDADAGGPPGRPAPAATPRKSANLTLAERLGLRSPAGPRPGDDDQEVGPVK